MRQFRATSITGRINVREVILEIDSCTNWKNCGKNTNQDRSNMRVLVRIIRREETATIQEERLGPFSAPDDTECVRCVPEFGTGLRQILGSLFDVPTSFS